MTPAMPFSQACENNWQPILNVLQRLLTDPGLVLEIGTGTGQHAVHFAGALPHLEWQPTDRPETIDACRARIQMADLSNLRPPIPLDVSRKPWPVDEADAVFSANTAHIMSWPEVEAMFEGVASLIGPGQLFCLYGPFHYQGQATSDSNREFDAHLRGRDPAMGIRDLADLVPMAANSGLELEEDVAMPANNRILVWRRLPR